MSILNFCPNLDAADLLTMEEAGDTMAQNLEYSPEVEHYLKVIMKIIADLLKTLIRL